MRELLAVALGAAPFLACAGPPPGGVTAPGTQLAIAGGNQLRIVDPASGGVLFQSSPSPELFGLAWRPDGQRLALLDCFQNEVEELEAPAWTPVGTTIEAASCPWDLSYSPDGLALAASLPYRSDPLGPLLGKLSVSGPAPLDLDLGKPLPALAWRPGGAELAVSTPGGLMILGAAPGYPVLHDLSGLQAFSLGYTPEGSRLIAGVAGGFVVLDAGAGYVPLFSEAGDPVIDVAIDPRGLHLALITPAGASLRRTADLGQVVSLAANLSYRDADFSPGGELLAIAESDGQVRLFGAPDWTENPALAASGAVRGIAFRPAPQPRLPVLFVHGHSGDAVAAFYGDGGSQTSFVAALLANPDQPLDAFFLQLPVHGGGQNLARSIADDALDILAWIEGGTDSFGAQQVGILNLPAYAAAGRVAVVAYSQGALSSRYYVKNLMGTVLGPPGVITVSELVTLAAPNHGVGGLISCGDSNEPDRARRQLCAGLTASLLTQLAPCGSCPPGSPAPFATNQPGDDSFLTDLNGHPLVDSCAGSNSYPSETPRSRPSEVGGVLYANLYAAGEADALVGGDEQQSDCAGRRLARLLSPDAVNREIFVPGTALTVHPHFPHRWEVICTALRTVIEHQVPVPGSGCAGLIQP